LAVRAGPAAAQAVRFRQRAPLARGNAALPRIAAPASPATAKINAALARLDAHWLAQVKACRSVSGPAYTKRKVAVTMAGPRVMSMLVTDDYNCSSAYPNLDTIAMAYDLDTGRP